MTAPTILLTDLGNVLIYSKEPEQSGKLNPRHKELVEKFGENYPFFDYFGLREKLVEMYVSIRQKYPIYMITEGIIQNVPVLKQKLEPAINYTNIFSTGELMLDKKTPQAYEYVIQTLGVAPETVFYIDDNKENVSAAQTAGLMAIQFTDEADAISKLKNAFFT